MAGHPCDRCKGRSCTVDFDFVEAGGHQVARLCLCHHCTELLVRRLVRHLDFDGRGEFLRRFLDGQ